MRALDIALKDLSQIVRDRGALFFTVVMPIGFTVFFGLILAPSGTPPQKVAFVDEDGGPRAAELYQHLQPSPAIVLQQLGRAEAEDALSKGKVVAALVVSAGFSAALADGQATRVELLTDPARLSGPAVSQVVQGALSRLSGAVQAARVSTEESHARRPFESDAARRASFDRALAEAQRAWQSPPVVVRSEAATAGNKRPSGLLQASPGMLVQFTVFGLMAGATGLIVERRTRTLLRLLGTPVRRAEIILGKALAMFVLAVGQQAILIAFGQAFLGVPYLQSPLALVLIVVSFALCVAALGLLLAAFAPTEQAAVAASLIAMMAFSALGGAWFPLEAAGEAFSTVGHLFPTAWAMDGFQSIVLRGQDVGAVLPAVAVILAYAAGFFAVAAWRFRYQ